MRNVIFGTLLGDGSLCKDRTTYALNMTHGEAQLNYLKWKMKLIGSNSKINPRISGYGSKIYSSSYYNSSLIKEVAGICLKNGKRTISDRWLNELDELSLAIWYQDDGSWGRVGEKTKNGDRSQRRVTFNTQGFDFSSQEKLVGWLREQGYSAKLCKHKEKYFVIYLNHSSTIRFWKDVSPYILLRYKIDLGMKPGVEKCECGVSIEPKMKICQKCLYSRVLSGQERGRGRIFRRFGTSSLQKLKNMAVDNANVPTHWVNVSLVGSGIDTLPMEKFT
jgi:hypothetical protein